MTLAELNGLGFTENELVDLAQRLLGETYITEAHDPGDRTRDFFNRVSAVLYGP